MWCFVVLLQFLCYWQQIRFTCSECFLSMFSTILDCNSLWFDSRTLQILVIHNAQSIIWTCTFRKCFKIFCITRSAPPVNLYSNDRFVLGKVVKLFEFEYLFTKCAFFQAASKLFGILWHLVDTVLVYFRQDQVKSCKEAFIQGRIYCVNFLGYCKEIINSYHPHNGLQVQLFHSGHR